MTAEEKYKVWLEQVPGDSDLAQELQGIENDCEEISSRFRGDLTFGTAGLRGIMGVGTDRMNIYTVRRAARAYGQYLKAAPLPDTCAIAYDTRNNSELFAKTCAVALAEEGIQVYLFPEPVPTPMLSFAVRDLKTGGGVVMTASHNPAAYNGMKCYGSDGCQQTDEPAAEVYARMQELPMLSEPATDYGTQLELGNIQLLDQSIFTRYYETVLRESLCKGLIPVSGVKVLYTPLHGTGLKPVTAILDQLGVDYDLVESQTTPDGNFPTCPYPNPETEAAFSEATAIIQKQKTRYDLILATDPDSDRMAAAVPQYDGDGKLLALRRFSGNELGCMMLEFILNNRLRQNNLPKHPKCIKSIVTTPMVRAIGDQYGCETVDVLTGFKYIGSTILELEQQGRAEEAVFAFEESCGFLKGSYVRDKDAQVACMLICELAAACKLEGMDLAEKMDRLYRRYGYFQTRVLSVELDGETGKALCGAFIDKLRQTPPRTVAALPVNQIADYQLGYAVDCTQGVKMELHFPKSNVLSYQVGGCGQVILRPSGTEPKLKLYFFASAETEQQAEAILDGLVGDFRQQLRDFGISC